MLIEAKFVEQKDFIYPIIELPDDSEWKLYLLGKKEEYYGWMKANYNLKRDLVKWRAKNTQMGYSRTILNRLLKNGEVDTEMLGIELSHEYGNLFCKTDYQKACQVTEIYATNFEVLKTGCWPGETTE